LDLSVLEEFFASRPEKTRQNYMSAIQELARVGGCDDLHVFVNELAAMTPKEREALIIRYISELRRRNNAAMTIHMKLTAVKHLLEIYGLEVNWKRVKMFMPKKRAVRTDKPIPKDVLRKALILLTPSKRLCVWWLFATGCRIGEALALRARDLDLNADPPRARVITEKSGIERVVFIPRDLAAELKEWTARLEPDDYVFHSARGPKHKLTPAKVRKAFQAALARLGYLKRDSSDRGWIFTLHGLRDTYKTLLTAAGIQGLVVETLMGHDTGIDRSYYKPSVEELAQEWRKAEEHLLLESYSISPAEAERLFKEAQLAALEGVWSALNPGQSPEDLYLQAARFRLHHYPSPDEKIQILRESLSRLIVTLRRENKQLIAEAFRDALKDQKTANRERRGPWRGSLGARS